MASGASVLSSTKALSQELKKLKEQPVEGFRVGLVDDEDLYEWDVAIFGPPDTLYQGGYFKARMTFPKDYPYSPPQFRFLSKFWHPNIYDTGEVCISILHPPGNDPQSGELPSERWNPTQSVRTILLSVISLLNEPNISSPANVDASIMYRKYRDGKSMDYRDLVKKQVALTAADAKADDVKVPATLQEYCQLGQPVVRQQSSVTAELDVFDYYDDYDEEDQDDDDGSDLDEVDELDDDEEKDASHTAGAEGQDNDSGTGTLNG